MQTATTMFFSKMHPLVLLLYFSSLTMLTMFTKHPLLLFISLIGSIAINCLLNWRDFVKSLKWFIPIGVITALINPLISHDGETPLLYVNHQAITLEALAYGVNMSMLFLAMFFWLNALSKIMSTDQFIYLFGKVSPKLALLISITMRLIQLLRHQLQQITSAQKAIGLDPSVGNAVQRLKAALRILSILITWALENAMESSHSMKARGYGLKGRTTFALYRWTKRDTKQAWPFVFILCIQLFFVWTKQDTFYFYPTFAPISFSLLSVLHYSAFLWMCLYFICLYVWEAFKWHLSNSKTFVSPIQK